MAFLKWLAVSFVQRVTRASLEDSIHPIGLLCKMRIFRLDLRVLIANGLLALKAPVTSSYLFSAALNHTYFLGIFNIQPVTLYRRDKE